MAARAATHRVSPDHVLRGAEGDHPGAARAERGVGEIAADGASPSPLGQDACAVYARPMQHSLPRRLVIAGLAWLAVCAAPALPAPLVLAAASLQESLNAAADAWAKTGHPRPVISFAASSSLARKIEAGAPADLFVTADKML